MFRVQITVDVSIGSIVILLLLSVVVVVMPTGLCNHSIDTIIGFCIMCRMYPDPKSKPDTLSHLLGTSVIHNITRPRPVSIYLPQGDHHYIIISIYISIYRNL